MTIDLRSLLPIGLLASVACGVAPQAEPLGQADPTPAAATAPPPALQDCRNVEPGFAGAAVPLALTELRSPGNGFVRTAIASGGRLRKGQVVFQIEIDALSDAELRGHAAAAERAAADVALADAEVQIARKRAERSSQLLAEGLISADAFDSAAGEFTKAQLRLQSLAAVQRQISAEHEARRQRSMRPIFAPFDGIVSDAAAHVGADVVQGQELATLRSEDVVIKFAVQWATVAAERIKAASAVGVCASDRDIKPVQATVVSIDSVVNPETGRVHGVARADDPRDAERLIGLPLRLLAVQDH